MAFISGNNQAQAKGEASHFAFAAMTTLFFIWGFITALNDILIPHLKASFSLSYTQAMLVQFCFFGAYFIVSPFAGKLLERIGYLKGIITGLCTIAAGCLLFYPAAEMGVYSIFLLGLFILAAGVATLQVSANPYVAILGPENTAASRLNLAQAINSLGHTLGPLFGAALIFSSVAGAEVDATSVQLPYLILAAFVVITAVIFQFLKLPEIKHSEDNATKVNGSIWEQKALIFGAGAIFLYVGAEVSIGSFLVNYFADPAIAGLSQQDASKMVSYYWGGAMIGRFVGAGLTRFIKPSLVLTGNAVLAIALLITTTQTSGAVAMWSVIAVGFFNSIMFPTIFSLAIRGLGELTSRGSGLLCQAIVGGAIVPMIQGYVADITSVQTSYLVPVFAYVYIAWYALNSSKLAQK